MSFNEQHGVFFQITGFAIGGGDVGEHGEKIVFFLGAEMAHDGGQQAGQEGIEVAHVFRQPAPMGKQFCGDFLAGVKIGFDFVQDGHADRFRGIYFDAPIFQLLNKDEGQERYAKRVYSLC